MTTTSPGLTGLAGDTGASARSEVGAMRFWRHNGSRILLACGLLVAIVLPLALGVETGSISIPHNDAWSYSRIGQHFGRTGEIRLLSWNRSSLVGQIVVLGPLARYIAVQQVFVALLSALGLLASYDLLAPTLGRTRAAFATLVLAVWPELGLLSTSFMSDVPALTGVLVCLALGRRALLRGSVPLLAASLAVGLWGVTVREQALAAPAAVLAAALVGTRYRRRFGLPSLVTAGAIFLIGLVAFELWRRSLAHDDPPADIPAAAMVPRVADVTIAGFFLLALAVAPAVFTVARPWRWFPTAWLASAVAAGAAVLLWHDHNLSDFLLSDYITPRGPYSSTLIGSRTMLPATAFRLLVLLAVVSGVLLAGLLVERRRHLPSLLRWFLVLTAGGLIATRAAGQEVFGRYLVVLIPALLCLLLARHESGAPAEGAGRLAGLRRFAERVWPQGLRVGVAVAVTAFLAVLSLLVTAYGSALDAARWHAGQQLADAGVPAKDIDAGFEWSGYHSPDGVDSQPVSDSFNWYSWRFRENGRCFAVSSSPQRHGRWRLVRVTRYRSFVVTGTGRLWVYDTGRCDVT